jgi:hypothetical protein
MTLASIRKALTPAVLTIAAVIGSWISSGTLDEVELRFALAGLFMAGVVYLVPNSPAP